MVTDISQPEQPIRIDTTGMSKEEVAELLSALFKLRAELEEKGMRLTAKRKKVVQKRKTI